MEADIDYSIPSSTYILSSLNPLIFKPWYALNILLIFLQFPFNYDSLNNKMKTFNIQFILLRPFPLILFSPSLDILTWY